MTLLVQIPNPIKCPSCYRRGRDTYLFAMRANLMLPLSGEKRDVFLYECHVCTYSTTEHEWLLHDFRSHYHRILNVLLNIRGWCAPSMNTEGGKLWVISCAIETYFRENQE